MTGSDSPPTAADSPPDGPGWDDLIQVVPRLIDRTRRQAELARALAGLVPCLTPFGPRRPAASAAAPPAPAPEHERVDVLTVLAEPDPEPEGPAAGVQPSAAEHRNGSTPVVASATPSVPAGDESDLPIQDYDSLAASQVVPRLATLDRDDLLAIQRYESATRGRQTILNRVAQLLSEP